MKNLANILIFCLLFVWQLPQNLVALCWLPFAGRVRKIAYRNYCIALSGRLPKNASGVSLGNFAIISPQCADNERTLRHEVDGHTVDSKIFGPLYLLVIGIPSGLHLLYRNIRTRMYDQTSLNSLEISVLVLLFQILFVQRLADFILLELPFVFIRGSGKPNLRDSISQSLHLGCFDAESHR